MTNLITITRDLLELRDTPLKQICEACNLSLSWLTKFLANGMEDPSVEKVTRLFEYLTAGPFDK